MHDGLSHGNAWCNRVIEVPHPFGFDQRHCAAAAQMATCVGLLVAVLILLGINAPRYVFCPLCAVPAFAACQTGSHKQQLTAQLSNSMSF